MITEYEGLLRAPLPKIKEGKKRYNVEYFLDIFSFGGGNCGGDTWIDLSDEEHALLADLCPKANQSDSPMDYLEEHLPHHLFETLKENIKQERYISGFTDYSIAETFDGDLPDDIDDMTLDEVMDEAISQGIYTPWESDGSVIEINLLDEME